MMKVYCRHKIYQPQKKTGGKNGKKTEIKPKKQLKKYLNKNKKKTFNIPLVVKEQYFHQIIMKNFIYLCTEYIVAYFVLHTNSLSVSCPF
jgi:hypothetical protein